MCWTSTYNAIALIKWEITEWLEMVPRALEAVLLEPATDSPADVDTNKMYIG
jgi:hypothetical protein